MRSILKIIVIGFFSACFIAIIQYCTKPTAPTVTTASVSDITTISAVSGGNVTNNGGEDVTERGVCWSTTQNPTTTLSKTSNGKGNGPFSSSLTQLIPNTLYHIRAYATNSVGTAYGDELTFTTTAVTSTVPGAPTIGTATAGDAQASITFTAPGSDGGSAITGYTATSSPGGFIGAGTASPITVTGLTNGTLYTFTVTATNAIGTGPASSASNSVTPTPTSTVPDAPTIGTATAGNAQATVTFTAPGSNGGSAITSYTVTSSPGGITATGSASPITITGLTNGTPYTFTVTATNAIGTGPASSASNSVTPSTVPDAPTIGTATAGNAQASVTFTAPGSNGGSVITGYTVTSSPEGFTGTGSSSPITVTGLTNGTPYTFTVTATNANGTGPASSASNSVTPSSFNCGTRLLDSRDGKTYLTVQIGNQCWFAENLNVGIRIDGTNDQLDNAIIEKYCYDNSESNCNLYGGFYQWDEMMQYSITEMTQGICPVGWHIPSDYEWKVMEMTLGMDPTVANAAGWRGTDEGGKLKAAGTLYWDSPNTGATNASQFNALPSGDRNSTGTFEAPGYFTDFWTSTFIIDSQCWYRYLDADHSQIYRIDGNRKFGTPIRCVKD